MTDADRDVQPHQCHARQGGGIHVAHIDLETLNLAQASNVAHRAVHDQRVVALGENGCTQVVARESAVVDFAEQVHHQHVARNEGVNHPGILAAHPPLGFALRADVGVEIRAQGHEDGRHHAPRQARAWVDDFPSPLELVEVALLAQRPPGLLGIHCLQPLEQGVGDLGAAVWEALARPVVGHGNQLIFRKHPELRIRRERHGRGKPDRRKKREDSSHGQTPN